MASVPNLTHWGFHGLTAMRALHAFLKTNCSMLSWKTWIFAFYSFTMDYIQVTTYGRQLAETALLADYPAFVMNPRGCELVCVSGSAKSWTSAHLVKTNHPMIYSARRAWEATCKQHSIARSHLQKGKESGCVWKRSEGKFFVFLSSRLLCSAFSKKAPRTPTGTPKPWDCSELFHPRHRQVIKRPGNGPVQCSHVWSQQNKAWFQRP